MGLKFGNSEGQTPLDEDEAVGLLIPTITTRKELDEFEQQNIETAIEWTLSSTFLPGRIFTEAFICELHHRMFGEVWKWAGEFRRTNKNMGCDWRKIRPQLRQLNDDGRYWLENKVYGEEEIAIRYKHRLVSIHCFSNGNGRHSRLMGDLIISHVFGRKVFTWGGKRLNKNGEPRTGYLVAMKKADKGEISLLLKFAKT